MPAYLVVGIENGFLVGATPCHTIEEAQEIAEETYNPHKYHTFGGVILMAWSDEDECYRFNADLHNDARDNRP